MRISLIWVVQQHQAMSIDRGFASSPLLHVDGETVIGTAADFSDPEFDNVLDLGVLATHGTRLMPDGKAWLGRVLEEERRR